MQPINKVSTVICERLVRSDRDMQDIEKCIVRELGGENNRCAFLRTLAYVKLRIAALYLLGQTPQTATYSDLQVVLTPTDEGGVVAVRRRFNEPLEDDSNISNILDAMETGGCQKRPRCETKMG